MRGDQRRLMINACIHERAAMVDELTAVRLCLVASILTRIRVRCLRQKHQHTAEQWRAERPGTKLIMVPNCAAHRETTAREAEHSARWTRATVRPS